MKCNAMFVHAGQATLDIYLELNKFHFLREAVKKSSFLSGPAAKAFSPPPHLFTLKQVIFSLV